MFEEREYDAKLGRSGTDGSKVEQTKGALAMLSGSVTAIGQEMRIDARLVAVDDSSVIAPDSILSGTDLHSSSEAAERLMAKLVTKIRGW